MELLFPVIVFGLMYLLLIRPQQQRARAQRMLVSSLSVGDEVVTVGGLLGRIVSLDDDVVTLDAGGGTRLRFRRGAISGKVPAASETEG